MHHRVFIGQVVAALIAACTVSGCQAKQGLYGADDFQSIGEVNGLPAYKAVGYYRYTDGRPEALARRVVLSACPTGDPQLIDGMYGSGRYSYFNQADWWWVTFTCDQEISLK